MKVYWTQTAIENLSAIYNYVVKTSPPYASKLVEVLQTAKNKLQLFLYLVEVCRN